MKKLIPVLFLCVLFIMSCSSQNNTKRQSHPFPRLTSGEDTLNTSADNISQGTGTNDMTMEDSCLSIANAMGAITPVGSFDEWVDTLSLDTLHTIAHALIQPGTNYITGLQIAFGIDPNYHLLLFFKPIALSRTAHAVGQSVATYTITPASLASNTYFTFDTAYTLHHRLVVASPAYVNTAINRFDTNIKISQTVTHPIPGRFNPTPDSTGSTKSVILSFQEIFNYILLNDSLARSSGKTFSTVNIYNTCIQYSVGSATKVQVIREDVMLGINNCTNYEDVGHLCPPDCENLIYPVYITQ